MFRLDKIESVDFSVEEMAIYLIGLEENGEIAVNKETGKYRLK